MPAPPKPPPPARGTTVPKIRPARPWFRRGRRFTRRQSGRRSSCPRNPPPGREAAFVREIAAGAEPDAFAPGSVPSEGGGRQGGTRCASAPARMPPYRAPGPGSSACKAPVDIPGAEGAAERRREIGWSGGRVVGRAVCCPSGRSRSGFDAYAPSGRRIRLSCIKNSPLPLFDGRGESRFQEHLPDQPLHFSGYCSFTQRTA